MCVCDSLKVERKLKTTEVLVIIGCELEKEVFSVVSITQIGSRTHFCP